MRTKEELQVWEDRWQALDQGLEQLLTELNGAKEGMLANFPRKAIICQLLYRLQLFGRSHFTYFHKGFLPNHQINLKEDRENYPPAAVLRYIIDQVADDLEILQRAMDQRLIGSPVTKAALKKADALGRLALQPAIKAELIDKNTTVLTYFQKTTSVRVTPYAEVAIIGLPFTAIRNTQDYLAIPHEVAHYVYRHGNYDGRAISSLLREKVAETLADEHKYLMKWLEETFADAYGCLVAGPVMAIDFQDLQLDDPFEEFKDADKDAEDPVPVLRPDIYAKAIAYRKDSLSVKLANLLRMRWENKRNNLLAGEIPAFNVTVVNTKKSVLLDDIRLPTVELDVNIPFDAMLEQVLKEALTRVKANTSLSDWSKNVEELAAIEDLAKLEQLYTNFGQFIITIPDMPEDEDSEPLYPTSEASDLATDIATFWKEWVQKWARRNQYVVGELTAERMPDRKGNDWGWIELAYADGWATRGPEPNPVGG